MKLYNKHRSMYRVTSVESSHEGKVTILWNQQERINRTMPNNKPDIITRDNERGTCMKLYDQRNAQGL
jgi:hypothetical protein